MKWETGCEGTVHREMGWKRKQKDGETDDQAEQKDGNKTKEKRTGHLLITAGLITPNSGHLADTPLFEVAN